MTASCDTLRNYVRVLHAALEELDQKMVKYGDEEGYATAYVIPVGPWHRIFALMRGSLSESYVEERLDANAPTPEQIAEQVARGGK